MNPDEFDTILRITNSEEDRRIFIHKYLFHGTPYVFSGREEAYFEFRDSIARHFDVSFQEVFIVGSAKLGFSYIKKTDFTFDSDVDVVIVNQELFDDYSKTICDYQYELDKCYRTISIDERKMYGEFLRYMIKGWMRPDKLPVSFQVEMLKNDWFDFFRSISNGHSEVGNYEVSGALYRNYYYLEKYHLSGVQQYYNTLKVR